MMAEAFEAFQDLYRIYANQIIALYPARIAAFVALKLMRWSRQNVSCLSMSAIILSFH